MSGNLSVKISKYSDGKSRNKSKIRSINKNLINRNTNSFINRKNLSTIEKVY